MIEKITFKKDIQHSMSYISNLPAIEAMNHEVTFKKGLNIIVGPNGSGKSAILRALGEAMAASQYGESCLSKSYLMGYQDFFDKKTKKFDFPFEVIHDGQPILYGDPKRSTGLSNGKADEEFLRGGILESMAMSKESSGEQANRRISPFLDILLGKAPKPEGLGATFKMEDMNDSYTDLIREYVETVFKPQIKEGQMTVLLDEPESSLGMMNQILLWEKILKSSSVMEDFQIILVSHSYHSLDIEGANYIEMKEGYLQACKDLMSGEITADEAKPFASNLMHDLTSHEKRMLKKIANAEEYYKPSSPKTPKTVARLEKIGFIESWTERIKPNKGSAFHRSFYEQTISVYTISAKGSQYLSMHS